MDQREGKEKRLTLSPKLSKPTDKPPSMTEKCSHDKNAIGVREPWVRIMLGNHGMYHTSLVGKEHLGLNTYGKCDAFLRCALEKWLSGHSTIYHPCCNPNVQDEVDQRRR